MVLRVLRVLRLPSIHCFYWIYWVLHALQNFWAPCVTSSSRVTESPRPPPCWRWRFQPQIAV